MKVCTIDTCSTVHLALGYCKKHYRHFKMHGDPLHYQIDNHTVEHKAEYSTWVDMKQRCTNPNNKFYYRYGGRGITVCERWLSNNGFNNFLNDMGKRPEGLSIDRINNDGNYEPSNCRWATRMQQAETVYRSRSNCGEPYISWNKYGKRYLIRIMRNNKYLLLTTRDDLEEAIKVRDVCMKENNLSFPNYL